MSTPSIGDCLNTGVAVLKKNPLYAIVGFLLTGIIGMVPFLIFPLMVGYLKGLKKELDGETAEIGDIFQGFSDFVPALIAGVLSCIALFIGFLLLFIPGLLIMPIPFIALSLIALGEKDGVAALKRAFGLYKAALVPTLILFVVLGFINGVSNIIPFGGLIVGPIVLAGLLSYVIALAGGESAAPAEEAAAETEEA